MMAPVRSRDASYGRRGAAGIGRLGLAALALAGANLVGAPAQAGPICGDRGEIIKRLEQGHDETPRALGLSADGGVLEILVSPKGGWTMLVTYPARTAATQDRPPTSVRSAVTCVVAIGEAWQMLQLAGQPA